MCTVWSLLTEDFYLPPQVWYNTTELAVAWDELLNASSQLHSAANYRHDLVDVTRQALQVLGGDLYSTIVAAFRQRNITHFQYVLSLPDLLIVLAHSF
jgi:alpha-N-acetylglucosaminidase